MVCDSCWETRNPQDFLRVVPEKIIPPWVRDEPSDNIPYVCYIFYKGGADTAQADCATADTPYRTQ